MVSSKQRAAVEQRILFICKYNSQVQTPRGPGIDVAIAIRLAYIMGIRTGLSQPNLAGDLMHRWIADHNHMDVEINDMGLRHEAALRNCLYPLQFTPEDYEHIDPNDEPQQ